MALDHFNATRVEVVLLHDGRIRLSKHIRDGIWRFPGTTVVVNNRKVNAAQEAERILLNLKTKIKVERILDVYFENVGDRRVQGTVYVLASTEEECAGQIKEFELQDFSDENLDKMERISRLGAHVITVYKSAEQLERE